MSWPLIHLTMNHFPIVGTFVGILFWAVALIKKDRGLQALCLYFLILVAVLTIPAYISGDPTGEAVEKLSCITKGAIDAHNDAGEISFGIIAALGACALAGLIAFRKKAAYPGWFRNGILALMLVAAVSVAWTAWLGGKIHHQEIHEGLPPAAQTSMPAH